MCTWGEDWRGRSLAMQKRFHQSTVTLLCRSKLQGFFFLNFCHIATVATIYKRKEPFQFGYQVRKDSRHFLEYCYILATSKNPVFKYGDFHVFLLRMWWTLKRNLLTARETEKGANKFWKLVSSNQLSMVLHALPQKPTLILVRYVNNFVVLHTIQGGHRIGSDILWRNG